MRNTLARRLAAMAFALAIAGPATAQSPDSLSETYATWTIQCASAGDAGRRCAMSQTLQREGGNERILLIEFSLQKGATVLTMIAPFGLAVAEGATLQTDEDTPRKVPFFTCLPRGCVPRETLDEAAIAALRRGASLKTRFTVAQSGEPVELTSSLDGFSAAYRRLNELGETQ